jgi:hypothetical protein
MAFTFRLEHEDGTPADPPVLHTAVPNWSAGDTIPLGETRPSSLSESGPGGLRATTPCSWSSPPRLSVLFFIAEPALLR